VSLAAGTAGATGGPAGAGDAGEDAAPGGSTGTGTAGGASGRDRVVIRNHAVEKAFCLLTLALGLLVIVDSRRIGAGWADDGPQSGYFPFYIGLALVVSSAVLLGSSFRGRASAAAEGGAAFVTGEALVRIWGVLWPLVLFVALIAPLGIYVAAALFIAFFMWRHGDHGIVGGFITPIAVPAIAFLMFERWFKVPLPKGPLEAILGLG
jgi:hypothetical protein